MAKETAEGATQPKKKMSKKRKLLIALGIVAGVLVGAWVLLKVTDALVGLRAEEDDEYAGLDLSQHSERAYVLGSVAD